MNKNKLTPVALVKYNVLEEYTKIALVAMYEHCLGNMKNRHLYTNEDRQFVRGIVGNFVANENVELFLEQIKPKSMLLNTIADLIQESAEEATKDLTPDNATVFSVDSEIGQDIKDAVESSEDMDEIGNLIASRVTGTMKDFNNRITQEKQEIKDIVSSLSDASNGADFGSDELNESVIKQMEENSNSAVGRLYANRPTNVFEQLVRNMSRAVLVNESTKDIFIKESSLDMDKIKDKSRYVYTMLEMVNTLRIVDVDSKYIESVVRI